MHFLFEIFDQRLWKLRQESYALASKRNDNQLEFGTTFYIYWFYLVLNDFIRLKKLN